MCPEQLLNLRRRSCLQALQSIHCEKWYVSKFLCCCCQLSLTVLKPSASPQGIEEERLSLVTIFEIVPLVPLCSANFVVSTTSLKHATCADGMKCCWAFRFASQGFAAHQIRGINSNMKNWTSDRRQRHSLNACCVRYVGIPEHRGTSKV